MEKNPRPLKDLLEEEEQRLSRIAAERHLNLNNEMQKHFCNTESVITHVVPKKPDKPRRKLFLFGIIIFCLITLSSCDEFEAASQRKVTHTYTWHYKGRIFSSTFQFPNKTYWYYEDQWRFQPLSEYSKQDSEHKYLEDVAETLYKNIENENYTDEEIAAYLLAFVQQSIMYQELYEPSYPIETLVRGYDDCKGKSILYASLLETFNIPCILVQLPEHIAVAVGCSCDSTPYCFFHNRNYYFCETTSEWRPLGSIPPDVEGQSAEELYAPEQTTSFQRKGVNVSYPETRTESYRSRPRLPAHRKNTSARKRTPLKYLPGAQYYKPSG